MERILNIFHWILFKTEHLFASVLIRIPHSLAFVKCKKRKTPMVLRIYNTMGGIWMDWWENPTTLLSF